MPSVLLRAFLMAVFAAVSVSECSACSKYNDCLSCASASGWDGSCRWCPSTNDCHDAGSLYNKCSSSDEITNAASCPSAPAPAPVPVPPLDTATLDPAKVLEALFALLKIDADAATCVKDVGSGAARLRDFAGAAEHGNATVAVHDLAAALTAFSSSVNDCAVPQLQAKLDALAARLHFADIKYVDDVISVVVGASDLWNDLVALGAAVQSKDAAATAAALAKLEADFTAVTGGCGDVEACKLVDGLLRIMGIVATDLSDACAADIAGAVADFKTGATAFEAKNYTATVEDFAAGLDLLAQAASSDACNLKGVGDIIAQVAPKLEAAIVKATGEAASIIVGAADVYDELYQATQAILAGDLVTFGEQIALLLARLRASGCTTKACDVLEGLLQALEIGAGDYAACVGKIDDAFGDFESGVAALEAKQWAAGVADLGLGLEGIAAAVDSCGIPELSKTLETVLTELGAATVAADLGKATQVLVEGADIVDELAQAQADYAAGRFSAFGADLANLAQLLEAAGCKTWVCKIVDGLLTQFGVFYSDLEACEADITLAEANFTAGAAAWSAKKYEAAVEEFAAGLNVVSHAVTDCGLDKELAALEQEANVLGIADVAIIGDIASVIVVGSDFYSTLYSAVEALEAHDYKAAGQDLGHVLDTLSKWASGHSCGSDFCFVVEGVMAFMGDIEGSIGQCEDELTEMWGNFSLAFHDFTDKDSVAATPKGFKYNADMSKIKKAVGEIGVGFGLMADAITDCHVEQLAELLAAVAAKLGAGAEIEVVEEVLHILIEGVQIEKEISSACEDFAAGNWVGFGYNLARLLKTLL